MHSAVLLPRSVVSVLAAGLMAASAWANPHSYLGSSGRLSGPGIPPTLDSFFDVFFEVELPGLSGGSLSGSGNGLFRTLSPIPEVFPLNGGLNGFSAPFAGGIEIEIVSLNLTGLSLTGPVMIRESPTLQSITITPLNQPIASFFDVFVELSFDSGAHWIPNDNQLRLNHVPDAGSVTGLLAIAFALLGQLRRRITA